MKLIDYYHAARPNEIAAGFNWYNNAHNEALAIADYCNVDVSIAAAVIACLSPRCRWDINLTWAWRVAHSVMNHAPIVRDGLNPIWPNVLKAIAILETRDVSILSGQKVVAFYDNILYPDSSREIAIDAWAYRAYLDLITVTDEVPHKITPKRYQAAANEYRQAAATIGILPCKLQAIVWIVSHRLEGK